jgi:hypothetical protein
MVPQSRRQRSGAAKKLNKREKSERAAPAIEAGERERERERRRALQISAPEMREKAEEETQGQEAGE